MAEVLPGAFPQIKAAEVKPKLPQREVAPPDEEQLSGPYGPRFVGFGPEAPPPLAQRLAPVAVGIAGGIAALGFAVVTGRIHL